MCEFDYVDDGARDYQRVCNCMEEAYEAILTVQEEIDAAMEAKDPTKMEALIKELKEWWEEIDYAEGELNTDVNPFMEDRIDEYRLYCRATPKFVPIFRPPNL